MEEQLDLSNVKAGQTVLLKNGDYAVITCNLKEFPYICEKDHVIHGYRFNKESNRWSMTHWTEDGKNLQHDAFEIKYTVEDELLWSVVNINILEKAFKEKLPVQWDSHKFKCYVVGKTVDNEYIFNIVGTLKIVNKSTLKNLEIVSK